MPEIRLGARSVVALLMLFGANTVALTTASGAWAYEPFGVTTQDGQHLTPEAEDFAKSYDQAIQEEWLVDGTEAADQALLDEKSFRKRLVGKLLPLAGRVLPLAGGAITAYEVCDVLIEEGCWLFKRDDTDVNMTDGIGWTYSATWYAYVDEQGYPNGAVGSYRYPALAGMKDLYIADPPGSSTPAVLRSNVPAMPAGATTSCGADYSGPAGFSEVTTAEETQCYYRLNGVRHWFSIPRSKWWRPADELAALLPQADDPEIPNATVEVPADPNWRDRLAQELAEDDRVRQEIGHLMHPEEVQGPYPGRNRHPECEPTPPNGDPMPGVGSAWDNPQNWNEIEPFIEYNGNPIWLRQGRTWVTPSNDWGGWGWRHIAAKHGWGLQDALATEQALSRPPVSDNGTSREYHGPVYELNGALCYRVVKVRYATNNKFPPRGIITSYGALKPAN